MVVGALSQGREQSTFPGASCAKDSYHHASPCPLGQKSFRLRSSKHSSAPRVHSDAHMDDVSFHVCIKVYAVPQCQRCRAPGREEVPPLLKSLIDSLVDEAAAGRDALVPKAKAAQLKRAFHTDPRTSHSGGELKKLKLIYAGRQQEAEGAAGAPYNVSKDNSSMWKESKVVKSSKGEVRIARTSLLLSTQRLLFPPG